MLEKNIIINALLIIAAIADFILSFVVIRKGRDRESSVVFGITCICVALWTLGIAAFRLTDNLSIAFFWNREFIFTAGIIPTTFLHFSFVFTKKNISFLKKLLIHLPNMVILISVFLPGVLIKDIVIRSWGKESILGYGYPLYGVFFTLYMLLVYLNLLRAYLQSKGEFKTRIWLVSLAISISVLFGSFFNLYLILLGNYRYIWVGPYASFTFVIMTAYAITKTELMDIRVVITRSVAYGIAAVLIIVSFIVLNAFKMPVLVVMAANAALALFWAWGAHRLREFIQTPLEEKWITGWYDPSKLMNQIAQKLVPVVEREEAFKIVAGELKQGIKIRWADIVTDSTDLKKLSDEGLQKDIIRLKNKLLIPLNSSGGLEAVLALGPKISEDPYDNKDLTLFRTLMVQILAILDRIRPYEKIKKEFEANQKKLYDTERQLARSERIASMASLIQEYNHEIRTPLNIMSTKIMTLPDDGGKIENFKEIKDYFMKQIMRAADIIENTLRLSKPKEHRDDELDLNHVIKEAIALYQPLGIRLKEEFSSLPLIKGDAEDLKLVFINLIKNAREAIPKPEEGEIRIKTYTGRDDDQQMIYAEVSDNGIGIPAKNLERIFEPFFSTHVTRGRGLGLSIVFRIVREHLGNIEVKSEAGKGAAFLLKFPAKG